MRSISTLLFLFIISASRGQLNYEGNPLTENTEYTAEESHYSKRNDPRLSPKFNEHNVKIVDSYVAAANSLIHDGETKKSTTHPYLSSSLPSSSSSSSSSAVRANTVLGNNQLKQTNDNINMSPSVNMGSLNYQVPSIKFASPMSNEQIQSSIAHTSNQRHDNTNVIQVVTPRRLGTFSSSNEALNYFLKSQTPEESQLALENYLYMHNQNGRGESERIPQIDNKQNFIPSSQDTNQQLQPDNLSNGVSVSGTTIPHSYPIGKQIYQIHPSISSSSSSSSSAVWHQVPIQSRRDFISADPRQRRPLYNYYGSIARPFRGRQRFQTRIEHGHYPPTSFISGGGKPPGEIIYTRPPGFHGPPGPPPLISNSITPYEDASGHFPISDHPPPVSKDILYSQLYSQSYDPHYYNYIAKTGKIKPWLYGKLGPKEESGFWHELYHSFKNHGMKNIMNPMFLLGLSIPAVTLMLSAMVNKRSFDGRSMRNVNQSDWNLNIKDLEIMQTNVLAAIHCVNERKAKGEDITKCAER